jgi:hypothetical protein
MMECVQQLVAEGLLECTSQPTMEYRVPERRKKIELAPWGGELIVLDDD